MSKKDKRGVNKWKILIDGYHGQDVIIFEEFRSSLKIGDMLNYLDGYPLSLPCRFSNKQACYTKVYIISNIPLTAQYNDLQSEQTATWKAFLRRINGGVVEYLANGNVNNYKTIEEYYSWQGMNGCKLIQEDLPFWLQWFKRMSKTENNGKYDVLRRGKIFSV